MHRRGVVCECPLWFHPVVFVLAPGMAFLFATIVTSSMSPVVKTKTDEHPIECHVATMLPGCAPCKDLEPVLITLKKSGWPIYEWNVLEDRTFYDDWKCEGTPTLILINNREEVARLIGFHSEKQLLVWFKKHSVKQQAPNKK